jgi:hypothetical protein
MEGGFDLCVNKLFVLPGTKLASRMERDGLKIRDSSKDRMFNYYCRLFWIASFSRHSRHAVSLVERFRILRKYPQLLNPEWVERVLAWLATERDASSSSPKGPLPAKA